MILPNNKNLLRYQAGSGIWQATMIHPNPRYFKYLWQIYTEESIWENELFFDHSAKLCTHDAMVNIENLRSTGRTYIVYNERLLRSGSGLPIDPDSERWKGCVFACPYEDDQDLPWNQFK